MIFDKYCTTVYISPQLRYKYFHHQQKFPQTPLYSIPPTTGPRWQITDLLRINYFSFSRIVYKLNYTVFTPLYMASSI